MKNFYLTAAIAASTITLAGCGSQSAVPNSRSNVQQNSSTGASNLGNSSSIDDRVSSVPPTEVPQNSNANDIPPTNGTSANKRQMVDLPGKSDVPPAVPAPENSSITTTMESDGSFIETRMFSGDGQIEKVVRISKDRNQSATVFLKSGRQLRVPADKIPALKTISLADLKRAAGITAKLPIHGSDRRDEGSVKSPR